MWPMCLHAAKSKGQSKPKTIAKACFMLSLYVVQVSCQNMLHRSLNLRCTGCTEVQEGSFEVTVEDEAATFAFASNLVQSLSCDEAVTTHAVKC